MSLSRLVGIPQRAAPRPPARHVTRIQLQPHRATPRMLFESALTPGCGILVLDDDTVLRKRLAAHLRRLDADVDQAAAAAYADRLQTLVRETTDLLSDQAAHATYELTAGELAESSAAATPRPPPKRASAFTSAFDSSALSTATAAVCSASSSTTSSPTPSPLPIAAAPSPSTFLPTPTRSPLSSPTRVTASRRVAPTPLHSRSLWPAWRQRPRSRDQSAPRPPNRRYPRTRLHLLPRHHLPPHPSSSDLARARPDSSGSPARRSLTSLPHSGLANTTPISRFTARVAEFQYTPPAPPAPLCFRRLRPR